VSVEDAFKRDCVTVSREIEGRKADERASSNIKMMAMAWRVIVKTIK